MEGGRERERGRVKEIGEGERERETEREKRREHTIERKYLCSIFNGPEADTALPALGHRDSLYFYSSTM